MAGGKQPDFDLTIYNKQTKRSNRIGAGWAHDNGSIGITLGMGVVINGNNDDIAYTLWPKKQDNKRGDPDHFPVGKNVPDDDIPF